MDSGLIMQSWIIKSEITQVTGKQIKCKAPHTPNNVKNTHTTCKNSRMW